MFVSIYHAKFTLSKTKCTKIIELKTKFKNLKLKCLYWIFSKQNDQQKVYMKNILVFKEQTKNIQYSIPQKKNKIFHTLKCHNNSEYQIGQKPLNLFHNFFK